MENVKHLNVHIPLVMDDQIKEICQKRKKQGMPNSTMRIVVVELLAKALELEKKENEPKRFDFND
ncbi:hypothetical protein AD998_18300 [bacterium 336/3]|nr:hypothetical protein AD998_18300 [bacterium 336/3]